MMMRAALLAPFVSSEVETRSPRPTSLDFARDERALMMQTRPSFIVTPAEAGVSAGSCGKVVSPSPEIPASAGMTDFFGGGL